MERRSYLMCTFCIYEHTCLYITFFFYNTHTFCIMDIFSIMHTLFYICKYFFFLCIYFFYNAQTFSMYAQPCSFLHILIFVFLYMHILFYIFTCFSAICTYSLYSFSIYAHSIPCVLFYLIFLVVLHGYIHIQYKNGHAYS